MKYIRNKKKKRRITHTRSTHGNFFFFLVLGTHHTTTRLPTHTQKCFKLGPLIEFLINVFLDESSQIDIINEYSTHFFINSLKTTMKKCNFFAFDFCEQFF